MWPWNQTTQLNPVICALPNPSFKGAGRLVAARIDTDHPTGKGKVAITGRYTSKKDAFGIDAAYAIDDAHTIYASYGVTEEKLVALGIESGFTAFGKRSTFDLTYNPPKDSATLKAAVRQGKLKLTGIFSFDSLKKDTVKNHSERYEVDAKISGSESLKMSFDGKSRAAKVKLSRKLDPKNKLDAEYHHISAGSKAVVLTLKHAYNKAHTFSLGFNYGGKKCKVEWDCKTENGPWTVTTNFPFNASPLSGDLSIKRRFDF
ncbi:hypothetical protein BWQ96_01157 [Gracilariopsis chorda]|uniref:Uncharacterized protein n=1 Tax=Gracilariopsis chorda TaxID=448386 RepID=A0A2V3J3S3_9FLOR|nr:hypothetical protein BWQ96_01157 [Gracilariopsis chorda]|eukprot:PXF49019.1 hypothetical protein BWQ96_01157 [Gracilariopsis chorda]